MDSTFLRAEHYQAQAGQFRKLAALEDDLESRQSLVMLAESYEKLHARLMQELRATSTGKVKPLREYPGW